MSRRARRLALWAGGALGLLAAGHTAVWVWTAGQVRAGYEAAVTAYAAQGWRVSAGPPVRAGWPLAAGLTLPGPSVSDETGTVRWTAERAAVRVPLFRPGVLEIVPAGAQTLSLPGAAPITGEAGTAVLTLPLDGVGPGSVQVRDLWMALPAGRIEVRSASARFTEEAVLAEAAGVLLPQAWRLMDGAISVASMRLLLAPAMPAAGAPAQRAALWRRSGGTLRIAESALRWGTLALTGSGVLRLDARLQPEGEASLSVTGQDAALDGAVQAGLLPARGAAAAKAVLALLSAGTAGAALAVPVQLQDGVLTVARFPLVRLPDVVWAGR